MESQANKDVLVRSHTQQRSPSPMNDSDPELFVSRTIEEEVESDEDLVDNPEDEDDEDINNTDSKGSRSVEKERADNANDKSANSHGTGNGGSSKSSKPKRIKRPMNAFMVWSSVERKKLAEREPRLHNTELSKRLGSTWKAMTEEEKLTYRKEAERLKCKLMEEHPDYKYRPRRRKFDLSTKNNFFNGLRSIPARIVPGPIPNSLPSGGASISAVPSYYKDPQRMPPALVHNPHQSIPATNYAAASVYRNPYQTYADSTPTGLDQNSARDRASYSYPYRYMSSVSPHTGYMPPYGYSSYGATPSLYGNVSSLGLYSAAPFMNYLSYYQDQGSSSGSYTSEDITYGRNNESSPTVGMTANQADCDMSCSIDTPTDSEKSSQHYTTTKPFIPPQNAAVTRQLSFEPASGEMYSCNVPYIETPPCSPYLSSQSLNTLSHSVPITKTESHGSEHSPASNQPVTSPCVEESRIPGYEGTDSQHALETASVSPSLANYQVQNYPQSPTDAAQSNLNSNEYGSPPLPPPSYDQFASGHSGHLNYQGPNPYGHQQQSPTEGVPPAYLYSTTTTTTLSPTVSYIASRSNFTDPLSSRQDYNNAVAHPRETTSFIDPAKQNRNSVLRVPSIVTRMDSTSPVEVGYSPTQYEGMTAPDLSPDKVHRHLSQEGMYYY